MEIETSISHMSNNESGETASLASRGQNNSIKKKKLSQVAEVANEKKEKKRALRNCALSLPLLQGLSPEKAALLFPTPAPSSAAGFRYSPEVLVLRQHSRIRRAWH